jgi:hypothetical protein
MEIFPIFKPKQSKIEKRLEKKLDERLKGYATPNDVDKIIHDREENEKKRQLLAGMSPHLRAKLVRYLAERNKNGKR